MVVTEALLFLLGTLNAFTTANPLKPTEIIIEKHTEPNFADKSINYELPGYQPFITNFMEHGTNVFFKPQIMLSPIYTAGHELIFDKNCNKFPLTPAVPFAPTPEFTIDEPVRVIETMVSGAEIPTVDKVVVIKPPSPLKPELSVPPIIIPPLPAVTDELVEVPASIPIANPEFPTIIPERINDDFQPAVIEEVKPAIPDAPELPLLSILEAPSVPAVPVPEPVSIVESYDHTMSLHIPEAPKLPPYLPPKLPLPVVMTEILECDKQNKTQQSGESPLLLESQLSGIENVENVPSAEILVSQSVLEEKRIDNLPAPSIPDFHEPIHVDMPISEIFVPHQEQVKPITIPEPPELPQMSVSNLPISVVISEPISTVPEIPFFIESKPMLIEHDNFDTIEIPAPPVLPPMTSVLLPIKSVVSESIVESSDLSPTGELIPILVNESKFESMEILPVPILPPLAVAPELPEIVTNEVSVVEVPEYIKPVSIPEAPLLSTITVAKETNIQKETTNIPIAPELPPLPFPSVPILMEQPVSALYSPIFIERTKLPRPLDKPLFMTFAEPAKLPISEVESIISFPTSCVKNIVIERVLPNIIRERKVEVFSSSNYPVLSSYSPPMGIELF